MLVENSTESAVLIYIVSKNVADEFILERTIPLDTEFKCEIGKCRLFCLTGRILIVVIV